MGISINLNIGEVPGAFWLLFVALAFFWIWTLVTLLVRDDLEPVARLTWVIVVIFLNALGAAIYYLFGPADASELEPAKDSGVGTEGGASPEGDG